MAWKATVSACTLTYRPPLITLGHPTTNWLQRIRRSIKAITKDYSIYTVLLSRTMALQSRTVKRRRAATLCQPIYMMACRCATLGMQPWPPATMKVAHTEAGIVMEERGLLLYMLH